MLTAFIEDAELATLTSQTIPQDFSYSPELDAEDEATPVYSGGRPHVHVPRTGTPTLPAYTVQECAAVDTTPSSVFDLVMYSIEPRWPPSYRESEFKCSRWLVAARACEGTGLWPRYVQAERAADNGTQSADVELRETLGAAWRAAGLHNISKHLRPPRHRHHSEKKKVRQQRSRRSERPREDNRIRLWLCPEVKEQRAAQQGGGILRGTLR